MTRFGLIILVVIAVALFVWPGFVWSEPVWETSNWQETFGVDTDPNDDAPSTTRTEVTEQEQRIAELEAEIAAMSDDDSVIDSANEEQVSLNCTGSMPDFSANVPFDVNTNMDVGDPSLVSIVMADNGMGGTFLAVIAPMYNLDFEAARIHGQYAQTNASINDVACAAKSWAIEGNVSWLYVGPGEAPEGYSKNYPNGWRMSTTMYDDEPINVEGADWETFNVTREQTSHTFGSADGWTVCQLWNGSNARLVWHAIIAPGFSVETPALQGTCWKITGNFDVNVLLARAEQMSVEVMHRDDNPTITRIYVGPATNKPNGWDSNYPSGWTQVSG